MSSTATVTPSLPKPKGGKLKIDENIAGLMQKHSHGTYNKTLLVCHETASYDIKGEADIMGNATYLANKGYGIHGLTDLEGHKAWALGLGKAMFYQAGGVNPQSIGIENVSPIPLKIESGEWSIDRAKAEWRKRGIQLDACSQLIACIWRAHHGIAHEYSDGLESGVTSHWDVSQHYAASEGHFDCHPIHKGGHFPILWVIQRAKMHYAAGLHF